jgi:amino acid adenylation domain-containing protein
MPEPVNPFTPFDREALMRSIPERFERQVEARGGCLAIRDRDRSLSYAELNGSANRLARAILDLGPASEVPVALLVDQGVSYLSALLAVLKAGHFFAPLDPRSPDARNRFMLQDSRARLLITDRANVVRAHGLGGDAGILDLDGVDGSLSDENLGRHPERLSLAYILYTSGSTGTPKGVMQDHRGVLHNTLRHTDSFRIAPEDRFTLFYPCSVYGGTRDIFNALLNGASLHRYPIDTEGLSGVADWMVRSEITIYCSVATIFRQLARTLRKARFPELRLMKLGGEAVYRTDLELFQRHFGESCLLSCGLASTETGAVRQYFLDSSSAVESSRIPCGHAIEDVEVRIVDPKGGIELPAGATGEIAVRSSFIALGYWQRPDLTESSFRVEADGSRVYRMGDLGRIGPDGQLHHLGRKDRQIKLRGNRIEIPEVEVALLSHERVAEVAVTALEAGPGDSRLIAYLVAKGAIESSEVREFLGARLPHFMVPSRFVFLDEMPVLPNGKINRNALAAPDSVLEEHRESYVGPRSETEARLQSLWQDVLETPRVGIHDDFFEIGGESLSMVELAVLIEKQLGVGFQLNAFVEAPTIARMARKIEAAGTGVGAGHTAIHSEGEDYVASILPIQPSGSRPPLFFVAPAGGSVLAYYALAHRLGADQPFYGLQVAIPRRRRRISMSIEALAARFLAGVREIRPVGPYLLGGWSFGGFVAYEMAVMLKETQGEAARVLLVDSNSEVIGMRFSGETAVKLITMVAQMIYYAKPFVRDAVHMRLASAMREEGVRGGPIRRLASKLLWRAGIKDASIGRLIEKDPRLAEIGSAPTGVVGNIRHYLRAIREYEPQDASLEIELFRPAHEGKHALAKGDPRWTLGWECVTSGPVRIHPLPGNHFAIFDRSHLGSLADAIEDCLRKTPAGRGPADRRPRGSAV